MEVSDLPTLFQIGLAQEANAQAIESQHTLFEKQQKQIDHIYTQLNNFRTVIDVQQQIIDELVQLVKEK
jgi:hypothetical protein